MSGSTCRDANAATRFNGRPRVLPCFEHNNPMDRLHGFSRVNLTHFLGRWTKKENKTGMIPCRKGGSGDIPSSRRYGRSCGKKGSVAPVPRGVKAHIGRFRLRIAHTGSEAEHFEGCPADVIYVHLIFMVACSETHPVISGYIYF